MAEETGKVLILGIELDLNDLISQSARLKGEIDSIKSKQKELADAGKANSVEFAQNVTDLKALQNQYKENNSTLDNAKKANDSTKGSITQMRAELAVSTQAWNNLSKEQRDNTAIGGKMQANIKSLSDELKKNESAIGDNRRNVGNYGGSILEALKGTEMFGGAIGAAEGAMGGAKTAVGLLSEGFGSLKLAIMSTGIGALVIALVALFTYFTETKKGSDLLAQGMAAMKAVFNELLKPVISLGEWLVKCFTSPKEAMHDFLQFLEDQIVNRIKGFGQIIEGIINLDMGKITDGFIATQTGILDATAKAKEFGAELLRAAQVAADIAKQEQILRDAKRETGIEIAKNNELITKDIIASKNKTKSDQDRIEFLKEASRLEEENHQKEMINAQKELELIQMKNSELRLTGQLQTKNEDEEAAAIIKISELTKASGDLQEKIINRQEALEADIIKRREAAQAKKQAQDEKNATREYNQNKALLELIVQDQTKYSDKYEKAKEDLLELEKQKELSNKELTEAEKVLIERKYAQEIKNLRDDALKEQERLNILAEAEADKAGNKAFADQLKLEQDVEALKKKYLKKNEDNQLEQLEKDRQNILNNTMVTGEDEVALLDEIEKKKRAIQQETTDKELAATAHLFGAVAALFKQNSNEQKVFSTGNAIINTYLAATKALASAPPPVSYIEMAATIAGGLAQVARINQVTFAKGGISWGKAEKGMVIGGLPHSQGGTHFYGSDGSHFEAEKDELLTIVNKRSTGMLKQLSNINMLGGGNNFFEKGGIHFLQDGGFAARSAGSQVQEQNNALRMMTSFINSMPAPIVHVETIANKMNEVNEIEARSTIG